MDAGAELCTPFLTQLPVSGAAVSMFGGAASETLVCASDTLAAKLDELQFDLGEGPRWEALRTKLPVLVPDVRNSHPYSWPVFSKAVLETEAAALFVFPVTLGALELGVVELHNTKPGSLSYADYATASVLAGQTAWHLLRGVLSVNSPDTNPAVEAALMSRREIHQATGMVLAQSGSSAADALLLMRAHAFAHALTLRETAEAVLQGRLSFAPGNDAHGSGGLQ
ncbi:GAF and ANTAR domain-containing protein [Arthrobacter bambusae]|uniref:GAF domain-containing protein n=1 Tax=Arthrobacter bambusae TaxID=1338426 RepID=A0AAW8DK11_9MICC|nr:GAF and ANTAR domain-containing protein [Arthrobacter bambusae]MDP9906567.1 GAF domain-containing protein [Arthrobacter bambusae]MDQ0129995.1 GAF domain-containing protein [Arthrobacter bambusae]MDQ0181375.1 GAF domain-containing protein [Arthrobacter bambusae]